MGNITTDKINGINATTGFYRNYGFKNGENLITQCDKTGIYRIFNALEGYPPDANRGDNDFYVQAYVAEDNTWIRLEVKNVRNSNVWELMCKGGVWEDWKLLPNDEQILSRLNLKVDKDGTKQLSDENFTSTYKTALNELVNTNYFRGYFDTILEIKALESPKNGWYGIVLETHTIWYYNNEWKDLGNTNTGDMQRAIYDPNNVAKNVYSRANHIGTQPIASVNGLQTALDAKLDVVDKTVVVDDFNSTSVTSALSANGGNSLHAMILKVMADPSSVNYGSYFGDTGGYVKLSSGLIIQFGQVKTTSNSSTQTFTFPIPFPNKCYVVLATCDSTTPSGSGVDSAYAHIVDNTQATVTHDYKNLSVGTLNHYVLAVGH